MEEVWKAITETDGLYEISNLGNIRSIDRYAKVCGGGKRFVKGKIYKPTICTNGYLELHASMYGKRKVFLIHRLVAQYFIPNPNNFPEVNHKDEDVTNNSVDNLEWCTAKYNCNYGTRNKRCMEKVIKKPVKQLSLEGETIAIFPMVKDAMRKTGINDSQIIRVCKGKNLTAGGYKWEYC